MKRSLSGKTIAEIINFVCVKEEEGSLPTLRYSDRIQIWLNLVHCYKLGEKLYIDLNRELDK